MPKDLPSIAMYKMRGSLRQWPLVASQASLVMGVPGVRVLGVPGVLRFLGAAATVCGVFISVVAVAVALIAVSSTTGAIYMVQFFAN